VSLLNHSPTMRATQRKQTSTSYHESTNGDSSGDSDTGNQHQTDDTDQQRKTTVAPSKQKTAHKKTLVNRDSSGDSDADSQRKTNDTDQQTNTTVTPSKQRTVPKKILMPAQNVLNTNSLSDKMEARNVSSTESRTREVAQYITYHKSPTHNECLYTHPPQTTRAHASPMPQGQSTLWTLESRQQRTCSHLM